MLSFLVYLKKVINQPQVSAQLLTRTRRSSHWFLAIFCDDFKIILPFYQVFYHAFSLCSNPMKQLKWKSLQYDLWPISNLYLIIYFTVFFTLYYLHYLLLYILVSSFISSIACNSSVLLAICLLLSACQLVICKALWIALACMKAATLCSINHIAQCFRCSPSCSSGLVSHRLQSTLQSQWVFSNSWSRTSLTFCLSSTIRVLELPSFNSTFTTNCQKNKIK